MKKNTRNLIIGLVVILILAAAAIVLALTGGQEEGESSSAASTERYSLIDKTKQDLATMEITNEGGTYTIRLEEKIVEASSEASSSEASSEDSSAESGTSSDTASSGTTTQWVYSIDGVADYLADTTKIENAARYGYSLSASKNLGKVEDLEDYDYRMYFRRTKEIFDKIAELGIPGVEMNELSMGMSESYEQAVECGATMVRVGSAIFGKRV